MNRATGKFITVVLMVGLLGLPAGLSAKQRRGADLIVTRLDGSQAAGELIAVRPDSILLLSDSRDLSIPMAEVQIVRIVRRSKAGTFSLIGGVAGFIGMGGVVLAIAEEDVVDSKAGAAVVYGLLAGAAGAVAGAIAGTVAGVDPVFTVAGRPQAEIARYWVKLSAYSREGRIKEPLPQAAPAPVPRPSAGTPKPRPSAGAQASSQDTHLRIALGPSFPFGSQGYRTSTESGTFRFLEEVPPGESDPYAVSFSRGQVKQLRNVYFGPLSLAYDVSDRLAAEIELFVSGTAAGVWTGGEMAFTSTTDGLEYTSGAGSDYETSFTSILAGLSVRSKKPTALDRHIFELGIAAGPAFARLDARPWATGATPALPGLRKICLAARVQAAYDFYIVPAFSVGADVGYRYLQADFAGSVYSADFDFLEAGSGANMLTRLTEVTLPVRPVAWSSLYFGLRCGFRI
jgi:hypothetical protein